MLALSAQQCAVAPVITVLKGCSIRGGQRAINEGRYMKKKDVDADLVARVQKGDKRAFDLLVLKYQRRIMRLLARMVRDVDEIEDLAQETFIKAYRDRKSTRLNSSNVA